MHKDTKNVDFVYVKCVVMMCQFQAVTLTDGMFSPTGCTFQALPDVSFESTRSEKYID